MSLVYLENCFFKKTALLYLSTGATQYFFIIRYSKWFLKQFAFFLAV